MNADPSVITEVALQNPEDGFETRDAGRAGARPRRKTRNQPPRAAWIATHKKAAHPISLIR